MKGPLGSKSDLLSSCVKKCWGSKGPFLLLACGLFVLSALVGLYTFFPVETLKQRIIQEVAVKSGAKVEIGSIAVYPLLSVNAESIRVRRTDFPGPLEINELSISPLWSSFLSGDVGAQCEARLMSGIVAASWQSNGPVGVQGKGLDFDLPFYQPVPFRVTGYLSLLDFAGETSLEKDTMTLMSLKMTETKLRGLNILGTENQEVNLGDIVLELAGKGRSMQVKSLLTKNGDFEIQGSGSLLVGRSVMNSRINLSFQVTPAKNATSSLVSILELTGKPDEKGAFLLRVKGTLANPVLN